MKVRVLVVEDSGFFRRRLVEILNADAGIEVVGTAVNGLEAIAEAARLKPDVITMDIEMPVMDGITAVRRIMAKQPVPVLMFSSLTHEGAQATLDALDAGAADFLPKRFEDIAADRQEAFRVLRRRVRILGLRGAERARPAVERPTPSPAATPPKTAPAAPGRERTSVPKAAPGRTVPAAPARLLRSKDPGFQLKDYRVVLIGTSTGGPVALQKVLTALPATFPLPLLLVQHMPASFTPAFAQRLDSQCQIRVREAADGDVLMPGLALLAPGGRQTVLESKQGGVRVRVVDSEPSQHYRPSVDVSFRSAVPVFGARALAIIMTGMGADGREGVRELRARGARVWTQNEVSCVVYGMPAAVVEAGLSDVELDVNEIGPLLAGSG